MRWAMLSAALLLPVAASAQDHHAGHAATGATCAQAVTVPGFEGFAAARPGALAIGRATRLALSPAGPPAVAGGRPYRPGTFRGEAVPGFTVAAPGRYRIAVSTKAWVAVQRAGGEVASVAHDHGPACSGIAKMLTFDLTPGRYALILSEAPEAAATVMVVRNRD